MKAIKGEHRGAVLELAQKGANLHIKNNEGQTPLQESKERSRPYRGDYYHELVGIDKARGLPFSLPSCSQQ